MRISPPRVSCRVLVLLVEGKKRHREEATANGVKSRSNRRRDETISVSIVSRPIVPMNTVFLLTESLNIVVVILRYFSDNGG
jgi:hypothetical protein